ncbi:hypothetical protein GQ54DRAFT_33329 [Martensiomyces pterosporus]|nr:hypothetical protein GQ54DRAFT_33329 [Martensiomyces pterosporus]
MRKQASIKLLWHGFSWGAVHAAPFCHKPSTAQPLTSCLSFTHQLRRRTWGMRQAASVVGELRGIKGSGLPPLAARASRVQTPSGRIAEQGCSHSCLPPAKPRNWDGEYLIGQIHKPPAFSTSIPPIAAFGESLLSPAKPANLLSVVQRQAKGKIWLRGRGARGQAHPPTSPAYFSCTFFFSWHKFEAITPTHRQHSPLALSKFLPLSPSFSAL